MFHQMSFWVVVDALPLVLNKPRHKRDTFRGGCDSKVEVCRHTPWVAIPGIRHRGQNRKIGKMTFLGSNDAFFGIPLGWMFLLAVHVEEKHGGWNSLSARRGQINGCPGKLVRQQTHPRGGFALCAWLPCTGGWAKRCHTNFPGSGITS